MNPEQFNILRFMIIMGAFGSALISLGAVLSNALAFGLGILCLLMMIYLGAKKIKENN